MVKIIPESIVPKVSQIKAAATTSSRLLMLIWKIHKGLVIAVAISIVIPGIVPFANAYIFKLIVDLIVESLRGAAFNYSTLYWLLGIRLFTYFFQEIAFTTQLYFERLLWIKVPIDLNQIFFHKIAGLDIQYYESPEFKDLLEKVKDSYQFRPQQLVSNLFYSLQSLVQLLIAVIAITRLNWIFAGAILIVAIPEFINQTQQSKTIWGIWAQNSPFRKRFWYLSDLLQNEKGIKEVKIFRLRTRLLEEIKNIQQKFYTETRQLTKRHVAYNLIFKVFSTAVFVGIEIYVIFQAIRKIVTIGDISFYTGVVSNFQTGLSGLFRNVNKIFENSLYVSSIFEVLDLPPLIKEQPNPIQLELENNQPPQIEFRGIDFKYPGTEKKILENFNLVVESGKKIAFVGENGAGKTTIIKLLARFYDPEKGRILINGIDLKQLDLSHWFQFVGILFQDFNKYQDTVKENILFGEISKKPDLEEIIKAAVAAGADSVIGRLEKGYEQMLGKTFEEGVELSGGQWQKIALARAFFRNAPILILDEPTSAIDARAEAEIFNRVENLSKNKTVIIVSHRFSTVRNADIIYVIGSGQIIETGTHKELMEKNGQYASLFRLQARGYQ